MAELDEILKRYTDPASGSVHGATFVAVDDQGNDIYRASFGSRKVDSQSKLVTSVATMQLVEKGLISLDDDVRDVVPALKDIKVLVGFEGENETAADLATLRSSGKVDLDKMKPKGNPIYVDVNGKLTLRQLMSHTSGFCYDVGNPLIMKWSAQKARTANMFKGTIVETLTSQDLDTYMQQNIWKPLHATHMTFHPTKHLSPHKMPPLHETGIRAASSFSPEPGKSLWPLAPSDAIGGAGLYGTANDYIKLLSCLLQGGAPLLKKSSLDELFRPQVSEASNEAFHAWLLMSGGHRLFRQTGDEATKNELMPVGHSLVGHVNLQDVGGRMKSGTVGWGGLPNLKWWVDRESGLAATLFTQIYPPGDAICGEMMVELETALYKLKGRKKE